MDTLTHIALGAIVGEAIGGKKLGKKALVIGAAMQCLPDIDFLAAFWLSPSANVLAHRGFTHSLLFAVLITPLLALLAKRWSNPGSFSRLHWIYFIGAQVAIHLILDSCNAYGVGLLEPFSNHRFSFHLLFVADILLMLPLILVSVVLFFLRDTSRLRMAWVRVGLFTTLLYLGYTLGNKVSIEGDVKKQYARLNIISSKSFTTPTPLNNWLWYAIAEVDSGYYASYHSVFDRNPNESIEFFYRNEHLLYQVHNPEELKQLILFSRGYYTVEQKADTLIFNVLAFGQIAGWSNPRAKFSFHYYLQEGADNMFVVQRGRFASWDSDKTLSLVKRIQGD